MKSAIGDENLFIINMNVLKQKNILLTDYIILLLLSYQPGIDMTRNNQKLMDNNFISYNNGYYITQDGINFLNKVEETKENERIKKKNVENLAKKLQSLFPEGKKLGTNIYWRGNIAEISDRLIKLFKMNGIMSDEIIINATEKYVSSFENDKTLMRTLKYFILKDNTSDLLSYVENIDSNDEKNSIFGVILN